MTISAEFFENTFSAASSREADPRLHVLREAIDSNDSSRAAELVSRMVMEHLEKTSAWFPEFGVKSLGDSDVDLKFHNAVRETLMGDTGQRLIVQALDALVMESGKADMKVPPVPVVLWFVAVAYIDLATAMYRGAEKSVEGEKAKEIAEHSDIWGASLLTASDLDASSVVGLIMGHRLERVLESVVGTKH
jgi:hypothetical protein